MALAFLETYKNCLNQLSESGFTGLNDIQDLKVAYEKNPANPKINKILIQTIATLVDKKVVLGNNDVVLNADRYFESVKSQTEFEVIKIGEVFKTSSGGTPLRNKPEFYTNGNIPWLKSGEVAQGYIYNAEEFITEEGLKNSSAKLFPVNSVLVAMYGATAGQVGILKFEAATNQAVCAIYPNEKAIPEYLYCILKQQTQAFVSLSGGGGQPNISQQIIKDFEIPLPPLEIQQQIVAEIEDYQKIIDGAKQIVNHYKPSITINPAWEMVELDQLCDVRDGTHDSPKYVLENGIPFVTQKNITKKGLSFDDIQFISREDHQKIIKRSNVEFGDIIISMIGANRGMSCVIDDNKEFSIKNVGLIKPIGKINHNYLLYFLKSQNAQEYISLMSSGGAQQFIGLTTLRKFPIPVPDVIEQTEIVKAIEEEIQLVNANKRLIEIFEQKIKTKIGEVWGVKENV